jgi:hypothetical protein
MPKHRRQRDEGLGVDGLHHGVLLSMGGLVSVSLLDGLERLAIARENTPAGPALFRSWKSKKTSGIRLGPRTQAVIIRPGKNAKREKN